MCWVRDSVERFLDADSPRHFTFGRSWRENVVGKAVGGTYRLCWCRGAYGADAQRAEKRRAIELHVRALEHAAACPGCERKACAKMAGYLRHAASCTQGAACLDCRRIDTLVRLHARRCTLDLCRVPGCVSLRERLRVESWKAALEG